MMIASDCFWLLMTWQLKQRSQIRNHNCSWMALLVGYINTNTNNKK
jgi:hypothetical protein